MLLRLPELVYVPVIALGVTPLMMPSIDFPLLGIRAFPDTSPTGRAKAKALLRSMMPAFERAQREFQWVLEDLGLEEGKEIPHMSERFQLPEAHLQMCIPSLELPRTDMPPNVRFIGGVPASDVDVWKGRPGWWSEVEGTKGERGCYCCYARDDGYRLLGADHSSNRGAARQTGHHRGGSFGMERRNVTGRD
jgi:hypothetical protein